MTRHFLRHASLRLVLASSAALTFGVAAVQAQTSGQTTQDRLGAVAGALFGDRLGLSVLDQGWLRGGRPLADGQVQFSTRVDTSLRSGAVSTAASTRLRSDYAALVQLETQYSAGGFSTQERADMNARYNALVQTLDSGADGYGDNAPVVAQGRADFETRVEAAVTARRITRTTATQLKTDYQALITVESGYLSDGAISTTERADLDTRLDALDSRVGDGPGGVTAPTTPVAPLTASQRLSNLDTAVTAGERSGAVSRTEAADIRVEIGDLARLQAAYARAAPNSDDAAYLTRRLGELELRAKITTQ